MTGSFFGYGSLVNLATHDYANPRPATLRGWRREWCATTLRDVAFLSICPVPGAAIHGIIADVPGGDWAALDAREAAYARLDVSVVAGPAQTDVAAYQVTAQARTERRDAHPILLSYLDVVVQGYARIYGDSGVADFFASTDNWDLPLLDDRHAPRYPRHQKLSVTETDLVDTHLAAIGVRPQLSV